MRRRIWSQEEVLDALAAAHKNKQLTMAAIQSDSEFATGFSAGFDAALTVLTISFGITIPEDYHNRLPERR